MEKIKYTYGEIKEFTDKHDLLILYNNEKVVYQSYVPKNELEVIITLNKNIIKNESKK